MGRYEETVATLMLTVAMAAGTAQGIVINYDNDPVLAKAMQCDSGLNGRDPNWSDRARAEEYYLDYLKTPRPTFQQARVYAQIGMMYAERSGSEPDRRKAVWYGIQVLQAEPNRVGDATILAREELAPANETPFGKIICGVLNYQWLRSLDSGSVAARWLPRKPGDVPSSKDIEAVVAEAKAEVGRIEQSIMNIPSDVSDSDVELQMRAVQWEHPGTPLARNAQFALARRGMAPSPEGVCSGKPSKMKDFALAKGKREAFDTLQKLCEAGPIQVMHSKSYYEQKIRGGEPNDKCAIWDMASGLRTITEIAMNEKLSQEEAFVLLERLAKLKERLIEARPTGAINIDLQCKVSMMMSGVALITDWSSDYVPKVQMLLRATTANDIETETLRKILAAEADCSVKEETRTKGEFLKAAVRQQYPQAVKNLAEQTKRELSLDDIMVLPLTTGMIAEADKSDRVDAMSLASDYVVARRCMFAARAGLYRREIKKTAKSKIEGIALLRKTVTADMDEFEKEILPQSESRSDSDVVTIAVEASDNGGLLYLLSANTKLGLRAGLGLVLPGPNRR